MKGNCFQILTHQINSVIIKFTYCLISQGPFVNLGIETSTLELQLELELELELIL